MMSTHHSVQMSSQGPIWLQCMCWQQTVPNGYIKIEFDIGYFLWYMPPDFLASFKVWFCSGPFYIFCESIHLKQSRWIEDKPRISIWCISMYHKGNPVEAPVQRNFPRIVSTRMKWGSGCGSVGRAVASNTRDPMFKSQHRQNFICQIIYQLYNRKDKTEEKEAWYSPSLKKYL